MRRVCVVTGSRAEYGLLRRIIGLIASSTDLELQLVVTGAHLSPEFGLTVKFVEEDGFRVDRKVEILLSSDTAVGVTKSMGLALLGFADVFSELTPDVVLVLGDRYEVFGAATAALIARIPIAHVHGGEVTEGAIDDAFRHSITKMASLHFVAAVEYGHRVIQLGESPENVFNVGGLGVDCIKSTELLDRHQVESALNFRLFPRNLLVTFHPETVEIQIGERQLDELLHALDAFNDTGLIFSMPNADVVGRALARSIKAFCDTHQNARVYESLGQKLYLSTMRFVDGVVGNSSSGLLEAPSFKVGTVNIGERQSGRLKAASVIDCTAERDQIIAAIRQLYSKEYQQKLRNTTSPYGEGGASELILGVLQRFPLKAVARKRFYNLPALSAAINNVAR